MGADMEGASSSTSGIYGNFSNGVGGVGMVMGFGNYSVEEPTWDALALYYFWTFVTPTIFGVIIIIGLTGNILVCYVIASRRNMRSTTNFLLMNLAISDIAFLVVALPFTAYKYVSFNWVIGDSMCKVVKYFLYVTVYVTVWSLVVISANRYTTVVSPQGTSHLRTKKNVTVVVALIWVVMSLINLPVVFVHQLKEVGEFSYCGLAKSAVDDLFITFFVFAYLVPLLAICLLYILIMCHLHKTKKNMNSISLSQSTKNKTLHAYKVIVLVVVVFAISWLPLHIQSLVALAGRLPKGNWYEPFRVLWNCMAYANSCANPIIYNFVSQEFKKSFREVLCCSTARLGTRRQNGREVCTHTEKTTMM